jgi:hypothetical protein
MKGEFRYFLFNHPDLNYWDGVLAYQMYRNRIISERMRNPRVFNRDQPFTITISRENIDSADQIPDEIEFVTAKGIIVPYYYEIPMSE